jgi:hypothetical protein
MSQSVKYVGLVQEDAIAVALGEEVSREVREPAAMTKLLAKLRAVSRSSHLLRCRAVRLRHPEPGGHRWPSLRRGRAIANSQPRRPY